MTRLSPRSLLRTLAAAAVAAAAAACAGIECPIQNTVYTVYAFDADGSDAKMEDTLWVWTPRGTLGDTLLIGRATGLEAFQLPISYQNPCDTLVFFISDTLGLSTLDTVWIHKDDLPRFESVDCNTAFFHNITSVRTTHYAIDTLITKNSFVSYDSEEEHFRLRLKPRY